jgi:hypothetical protein
LAVSIAQTPSNTMGEDRIMPIVSQSVPSS